MAIFYRKIPEISAIIVEIIIINVCAFTSSSINNDSLTHIYFSHIFIISTTSLHANIYIHSYSHYSTSEGSKQYSDLMTVINYFQEHLLNNFPCRIRSFSFSRWGGVEKYLENANVECSKHASHLIHSISNDISHPKNNIHTK